MNIHCTTEKSFHLSACLEMVLRDSSEKYLYAGILDEFLEVAWPGGSDACGQGLQHSGLIRVPADSHRRLLPGLPGESRASAAELRPRGPAVPGAAPLPGSPAAAKAPSSRFRTASQKRTSGVPGCQAARRAASKLQAPREEKGQCAFAKLKSPSPGAAARAGGARARGPRCNSAGSQAGGAPPGQKGLSAERRQPGGLGEHKGRLCPCSSQVHLCLRSPSQRKVTEEPAGSPPSSGVWSTGMAKFFLQDAGNSDENRTVLAGTAGSVCTHSCVLLPGPRRRGKPVPIPGRAGQEGAQANLFRSDKNVSLLRGRGRRWDRTGRPSISFHQNPDQL